MNKLLVMGHPTLNANSRAAGAALARAGLIGEFHTMIDPQRIRWAPARLSSQLRRRELPNELRPLTRSHPIPEMVRLATRSIFRSEAIDKRLVDLTYRHLDAALAHAVSDSTSAVYGYEDGAAQAFRRASQLGIGRLYDLPIGYWRAGHEIFREEAEREPAWAGTLTGLKDGASKLDRKDEELSAATSVFVASSFTRHTLSYFSGPIPDVHLLPYGTPPPVDGVRETRDEVVRVLFVGGLSQRKGLSYLFDALDLCDVPVRTTVVGRKIGESKALDSALARRDVRWIQSLPHASVLELMRDHDVLVFPSLFEGFGLVITEALSQGLPVLTTPHTAGPDVLSNGVDGWIVPVRSVEALAERISSLTDIDARNAAKHAALAKARQLSWDIYGERVVSAVSKSL